ncbi:MAG: AAA family ATPase [Elusimicrobia bacterium]|nr:AAA family ATPase [Elusimicrobiota bacterium]
MAVKKPKRKSMVVILYGKGGVGKTTVSSHLAACYAAEGRKVLLLGCDPKTDTSTRFLAGLRPPTMLDMVEGKLSRRFEALLTRTPSGVDVMETGGPEPGVGCGGRGVATLCQFLEEHPREFASYDVAIFDVLGDLVCGGFVAPLRFGRGNCVFVVSSEEPASLFAANNIARMTCRPYNDAASVGGIIFNLRRNDAPRGHLTAFARRLGVGVIGAVERDRVIMEAEERGLTALAHAPRSKAAHGFGVLAHAVERVCRSKRSAKATPMTNDEFWAFVRSHRIASL